MSRDSCESDNFYCCDIGNRRIIYREEVGRCELCYERLNNGARIALDGEETEKAASASKITKARSMHRWDKDLRKRYDNLSCEKDDIDRLKKLSKRKKLEEGDNDEEEFVVKEVTTPKRKRRLSMNRETPSKGKQRKIRAAALETLKKAVSRANDEEAIIIPSSPDKLQPQGLSR